MQRVFAQIGLGDWIKIAMIGILGVAMYVRSDARSEQFEAVAIENQTEIRAARMERSAIRARVAGSEANIAKVGENLDRTTEILDGLLARMRQHDVDNARRETEIRNNRSEIDRLRQGE